MMISIRSTSLAASAPAARMGSGQEVNCRPGRFEPALCAIAEGNLYKIEHSGIPGERTKSVSGRLMFD
jgi:hypothetical protein